VDYVIPGNDDALRAIRLFASKIADSVVEGSQVATDKQFAEITAAAEYAPEGEAATGEAGAGEGESADNGEVSMEEVLGAPARKRPAAAGADSSDTAEVHAESQTF